MDVVVEQDGFGPVHRGVQLGIRVQVLPVQVHPAGVGSAQRDVRTFQGAPAELSSPWNTKDFGLCPGVQWPNQPLMARS